MSGPTACATAASVIKKPCSPSNPYSGSATPATNTAISSSSTIDEHPYTFPADKPFMWIRGRQVGGKTFCWARVSYRYSDFEFQAAARDGYGENWPVTYKEMEPYYDRVEQYIGVSGSAEGLPQFPDGKFLPPMRLSCGEIQAGQAIERRFGWRIVPDRTANLTVPHNGRPACHYCDQCQRGCYTASYFNSPSVTLPDAARTGRFTLVSDAIVSHLAMDDRGKASGVVFLDRQTRAEREAHGRAVVLAASALESTRILLNSRSPRFPEGVGASSGVLGHYLMDHFTLEQGGGLLPALQVVAPRAGRASRWLYRSEIRQCRSAIRRQEFPPRLLSGR